MMQCSVGIMEATTIWQSLHDGQCRYAVLSGDATAVVKQLQRLAALLALFQRERPAGMQSVGAGEPIVIARYVSRRGRGRATLYGADVCLQVSTQCKPLATSAETSAATSVLCRRRVQTAADAGRRARHRCAVLARRTIAPTPPQQARHGDTGAQHSGPGGYRVQ
jgi:hypothetical protein